MTNLRCKKTIQVIFVVMLTLPLGLLALAAVRSTIHLFTNAYVSLGPDWLYSGYANAMSVLVSALAGTLVFEDYYSGGAVSEANAQRLAAIFPKSKFRITREDQGESSDPQ